MNTCIDVDLNNTAVCGARRVDNPEKLSRGLGFAMIDQDQSGAELRP